MTPYENVASRLSFHSRKMARCPAHSDKVASLSVTEFRDGKVGLHCFAGCTTGEICEAIGLSLRDLFPKSSAVLPLKMERRRINVSTAEAMAFISLEADILATVGNDLKCGRTPSDEDINRAVLAAERIAKIHSELSYV